MEGGKYTFCGIRNVAGNSETLRILNLRRDGIFYMDGLKRCIQELVALF